MAYMLLAVESNSGFLLGSELLEMGESEEELWGRIPAVLLGLLVKSKLRPRRLRARVPLIAHVLNVLKDELDLSVKLVSRPPELERAQEFLLMGIR